MGKTLNENQKKFTDLIQKHWYTDGQKIKVGNSPLEMMSGKATIIEVKEILDGDISKTWKIVVDKDDKIYLLKAAKELK